jgi:large subunit ribosomal protein L30
MVAKAKKTNGAMIKVTQIKSVIGRIESHRACVSGLGLRRMHHTVEVEDTPAVRGMINKVGYLLKVEG